ncbi:hypothetical protein LIER_15036 [Lithospermum erythrorhizon]|uniref:F-box associated beta-propeller type 3 domain-containing protein n=1 Tax=Lithospermum erythrorhizon TaxID=34254 RepID=A0AAV3Q1B5_LITER
MDMHFDEEWTVIFDVKKLCELLRIMLICARSSSIIKSYSQSKNGVEEAMHLFDTRDQTKVISACSNLSSINQAQNVHGYVIKSGFWSLNKNSLINMYSNCGYLHLSRADSIHVVQSVYDDGYKRKAQLSLVDCTREKKCMDLVSDRITGKINCTIWGSCGGLLASWSPYKRACCICIVNPITGENRDISTPSLYGYLCGFFFDRFQGRYKVLYVDLSKSNVNYVYYTFDLSESVWKKLDLIKSRLDICPNRRYPGVIVGDAVHWIWHSSKMVVVFKIETEELYSLPHPPVTTRRDFDTYGRDIQLIAKDGQLCFCHKIAEERAIDLWILEDYENGGSWVKKFKVSLVSIHKLFRSSNMHYCLSRLRIGSPQNGSNEILVTWAYFSWKGLYGYHLETHRSRQLETPGRKRSYMLDYAIKSRMTCSIKKALVMGIMGYVMLPYTKTMLLPMF